MAIAPGSPEARVQGFGVDHGGGRRQAVEQELIDAAGMGTEAGRAESGQLAELARVRLVKR